MQKIIYIVGPTGVGKTALAFRIAKKFNGELVNADSVQVYKGLEIISGKDIPQGLKFEKDAKLSLLEFNVGYYNVHDIPIYLLDIVEPTYPFSVSQYQILGEKVIRHIFSKGKTPIVVGGTGLYIKSSIDGIPTKDIPYDKKLRLKLEKLSVEELHKIISKKRLSEMNDSDSKNKRRLIRAIEIEKSNFQRFNTIVPFPNIKHLQIGLNAERKTLKERISKRVDVRIKNGAVDEVKRLFEDYNNLTEQVKNTNGYREMFMFLKNEISLDDAIEKWKISEYQLSKRQMTWFRKDKRIEWFDIARMGFEADINEKIDKFLH